MKKVLITIAPLYVVFFVLMWISLGLKGMLISFGVVLFAAVFVFVLDKWVDFVDKHIKD